MKKFLIQIFVLLIVIFAGIMSIFNPSLLGMTSMIPGGGVPSGSTSSANLNNSTQRITFLDQSSATSSAELVKSVLTVEVASTAEKRAKGLSYRDSMAEDMGMLFLFDSPQKVRFIMTGMRFPLDFIWVNGDQIVDMLENIPIDPAQNAQDASHFYQPVEPVDHVIEVNAGYLMKHNIRVGDRIRISNI